MIPDMRGWWNESKRHALAAQGVRTGRKIDNLNMMMPMTSEEYKRGIEEEIGYPIYDETEKYPEEYDALNHNNPLFTGLQEPQQKLMSVPTLNDANMNKTKAKDFDRPLLDF